MGNKSINQGIYSTKLENKPDEHTKRIMVLGRLATVWTSVNSMKLNLIINKYFYQPKQQCPLEKEEVGVVSTKFSLARETSQNGETFSSFIKSLNHREEKNHVLLV